MSNSQGDKPNPQVDRLLALYSEKMKYLAECHKVYYWMLALFGTGLVVSAGFLLKSNRSDIKEIIPYLTFGAPILINAWCAGYLFCYWHNNLLCRNIDYLEEMIGNSVLKNELSIESFPTWYRNFFRIFTDAKWFIYPLFSILALVIFSLDGFCIFFALSSKLKVLGVGGVDKDSLSNILDCGNILYVIFILVIPIYITIYHVFFNLGDKIDNKIAKLRKPKPA